MNPLKSTLFSDGAAAKMDNAYSALKQAVGQFSIEVGDRINRHLLANALWTVVRPFIVD